VFLRGEYTEWQAKVQTKTLPLKRKVLKKVNLEWRCVLEQCPALVRRRGGPTAQPYGSETRGARQLKIQD